MEDPGAGARARGEEDHGADARSRAAEAAASAAPEPSYWVRDATEVCGGAPEVGLSAEVDEEKGGDFAALLVDSVEPVSASLEGRKFQIGKEKGSSSELRVMGVEEDNGGSLAPAPQSCAEAGSLQTCREANGGLSNKTLCAPCGGAVVSKDAGCVYGMLEKTAEGSQFEQGCLAGNGGDWGGVTDVVKTTIEDLQMVSDEAHHDNEGLSDSMNHASEHEPRGVGSVPDANDDLRKDVLMPNIETEVVSRAVDKDSVPSISGSIDLSLDGKAGHFGGISCDPVTGHVAGTGMWNNGLCASVRSQSIAAGCMDDISDIGTGGSPCWQGSLVGDTGVSSDAVDVSTSSACCKGPHCGNEGFPDLVRNVEWLPCSTGVKMCLENDTDHDLVKDGLLPKVAARGSRALPEGSIPSVSGSGGVVSLDGKACQSGVLSDRSSSMEKVAFGQGCGVLSYESGAFHNDAPGCERRSSREMSTSEEDLQLQTGWMEAGHDDRGLSGKNPSEKLPCGADDLTLITGSNHELEKVSFLPNVAAVASCPVDEASISSIYGSSIDAPLDGQACQAGDTSENNKCLGNLACDSLGGNRPLCDSSLRMEPYGDKNQHSGPCADEEVQRISQSYGTSELPAERNLCISPYNQPCDEEPCCSGRESSALLPGHQDSSVGRSSDLYHFEQGLNACNSADDKTGSNDGESQSQKLTTTFVFRRRNPRRAASSRNLNSEKPDQKNKAGSGTHKPKKLDITSSLHQNTMSMFPNKITKGRRGMNRPQKSTWGSLNELLDGCCKSYGPSTSNPHPTSQEKGRSDNRSDQRSRPSIRKSRSSRSSKSKCSTLSDIGHAVSELNGKPTLSSVADTDASFESHIENIPKLSSDTSTNIFYSNNKTAQSSDSNCTVKLGCIQNDTQQVERGLVSSSKETCAQHIHGECGKLSTSEPSLANANGTVMLHVGFSPDSVLEVASVTCEGNASANHDVALHENSTDTSALIGGAHHPSRLSTSNIGKVQAPSLMNFEQQVKTSVGSENSRKEEIGPSHLMTGNDVGEGKVQALQKLNTESKNSIVRKPSCKKKDGLKGKKMNARGSTKILPCQASKRRTLSNDLVSPDTSELLPRTGPVEFGSCFEALTSGTQDLCMHDDSILSDSVTDGDKGSAFDSLKSQRRQKKDANAGKKGKVQDTHKKGKGKKNIADGTFLDHGVFNLPSAELAASHMNEQSNPSPDTELVFKNSGTISTDLPGNVACKMDGAYVPLPPPPRAAWACCDDCHKWRCIPAELADAIGETNCRWTCKDNKDKAFADCSIPQEKTNAEINAELELSDASADEADDDGSNSKACRAPSWTHVRSNLFLHRNRRTQSIDESMVCNCEPPQDGRMGCRDGCLNRMLNIECAKRTCPCGEQCSNQKFQRRSYAKLKWFLSGKKGYGLQLQEDVSEGRFLIEYVGEVLDITSYESRQRFYASKGQKHFYFMALNGGEVIDACTKGNLGRFINHSCSPNCRTEKWMVNGEVCIGIFAMRNIKKGEELTFDYNYVRVSGAAPQKCFCGTTKCRGYIGGDISVADSITQGDVEAGTFEQMADDKGSEEMISANGSGSDGSHPNIAEPKFSIQGEELDDCSDTKAELETLQQTVETLFDTSEAENSLEAWSPQEDEDVIRTPVHVSQSIESSLQQFPVHGTQSSDLLQKTANSTEGSKAPNIINVSASSSDFRSNLASGFNAYKRNNLKQHKNMKPSSSSPIDNEHILGVEGRLNKLLDGDGRGGISKRKDATNGYLKLLLVTAAEGDSAGGSSKSVRDLSLILDALLKTKSSSVLLDIINKNGLQMLHNILKQNRSNFHRTPIIRKLLKVLEFLAQKGILTSEHINGGPRCAGVESFRDSMLSLIRHKDFQVQQAARNFRDTWIFGNITRSEPTDHIHALTFGQDIQGTDMVWNSARRKRKSRWDYQPDEHYKMVGLKIQKAFSGHSESDVQFGLMRNKLQRNQGTNNYHNDIPGMGNSTEGADDEAPPGFESQQERHSVQLSLGSEVAPGLSMERYQPSLGISYGVPVALVQHFGTPEPEGQCHKKWKVAPGVPFSPFPPLPPYPRGSPCPSTLSYQMFQHDGTPPANHNSAVHCGRTVGGRVHRTWRNGPRTKWPYHHQGRRFSSNHHRFE